MLRLLQLISLYQVIKLLFLFLFLRKLFYVQVLHGLNWNTTSIVGWLVHPLVLFDEFVCCLCKIIDLNKNICLQLIHDVLWTLSAWQDIIGQSKSNGDLRLKFLCNYLLKSVILDLRLLWLTTENFVSKKTSCTTNEWISVRTHLTLLEFLTDPLLRSNFVIARIDDVVFIIVEFSSYPIIQFMVLFINDLFHVWGDLRVKL